ncbi:MAG: hypothetical protein JSV45_10840 [Chromatiales bacterium]|nr:MAG: hypothetical protein JSV45_10840 [Chromatiales bacterium]
MRYLLIAATAAAGLASGSVYAFDTDKIILCATTEVQDCLVTRGCEQVQPEDVSVPTFMRLNLKKNRIEVGDQSVDIERSEEVENRLIMQGAEDGSENRPDGVGWTLSVSKDTGRFVATLATEQAGLILFGACTEI